MNNPISPSTRTHYSQFIWDKITETTRGFGLKWFHRKMVDSYDSTSYMVYITDDTQTKFSFFIDFKDKGVLIRNSRGLGRRLRDRVSINLNNIDLSGLDDYLCGHIMDNE